MTPVEERIDHAQIARRLTTWANARERRNGPDGHGQTGTQLLRDAAALLTEHSAREHPLGCEACMVEIRKAVARGVTYLDNSMLCSDALPATESAQPATNLAVTIEPDALDGGFVAECVSLPGCASQGETQAESLRNLADALDGVLESAQPEEERR